MGKLIDLTGQRFGRLVVIERAKNQKNGHARWVCRCDCGKTITTNGYDLRSGHTRSCGCIYIETLKKRSITHGLRKTKLYSVWGSMKDRCNHPSDKSFPRYGGRGITVCEEWRNDFLTFYDWAISHGYQDGLSIDRIDNDGPYSPENCQWVTATVQNNNKRSNRRITFLGKTHTIAEWAKAVNIPWSTLRRRLRVGWTIERALTTPVRPYRKKQK